LLHRSRMARMLTKWRTDGFQLEFCSLKLAVKLIQTQNVNGRASLK
jgi:hypothetical protein